MDWADAQRMLRTGKAVARHDWNARWQYVIKVEAPADGWPRLVCDLLGLPPGEAGKFRPFLLLHTAQDTYVPWQASQADWGGDDWVVAEL